MGDEATSIRERTAAMATLRRLATELDVSRRGSKEHKERAERAERAEQRLTSILEGAATTSSFEADGGRLASSLKVLESQAASPRSRARRGSVEVVSNEELANARDEINELKAALHELEAAGEQELRLYERENAGLLTAAEEAHEG